MIRSLAHTLLELAHATSQNLAFAHGDDVNVSYGEETITETNLLELRRRHPVQIELRTFGKKKEARNGADWEWHIRGRAREFRMRVQAKRVQRDGRLKIPHAVRSSGDQQIDLLMADAKRHGVKPVYCFYSSEKQRCGWKMDEPSGALNGFEYGCLLASAHKVLAEMPTTLKAIENFSVPWHFLAARRIFLQNHFDDWEWRHSDGSSSFLMFDEVVAASPIDVPERMNRAIDFPTLDDLNSADRVPISREGIFETETRGALHDSSDHFRERGVSRLLVIDVREARPSDSMEP